MKSPLLNLAIAVTAAGSLFWLLEAVPRLGRGLEAPPALVREQPAANQAPSTSNAALAQVPPPAPRAAHVEITQGPALELAHDDLAIIRWTANNPGGSDDHFAVVFYGTSPLALTQAARSHVRLNRGHPETIFRVRISGLRPRTTYYYSVTSTGSDGASDGVQSPVGDLTTPGPGEWIRGAP
jgi:Purple acid Phosphatase, N-terminal domain